MLRDFGGQSDRSCAQNTALLARLCEWMHVWAQALYRARAHADSD